MSDTVIERRLEAASVCPCCGTRSMSNALVEASSVKGVNLLNRHWAWLDDYATQTGVSRSEALRMTVDAVINDPTLLTIR